MKTLLKKITSFQLTTPIAVIVGSLIFSFHYVWINKYEVFNDSPSEGVITIVNKWTGKYCSQWIGEEGLNYVAITGVESECEDEDFHRDIKLP